MDDEYTLQDWLEEMMMEASCQIGETECGCGHPNGFISLMDAYPGNHHDICDNGELAELMALTAYLIRVEEGNDEVVIDMLNKMFILAGG